MTDKPVARRLAAIVSADVAGYSRLMEGDEAGTLATLKRYREDVLEFAEMLGLDPLLVANEGKVLFCLPKPEAEKLLTTLRAHPLGREAAIIGDVIRKPKGMAIVETAYGSRRVLEMPIQEQLPRIC